jgi:hypothetical protein
MEFMWGAQSIVFLICVCHVFVISRGLRSIIFSIARVICRCDLAVAKNVIIAGLKHKRS